MPPGRSATHACEPCLGQATLTLTLTLTLNLTSPWTGAACDAPEQAWDEEGEEEAEEAEEAEGAEGAEEVVEEADGLRLHLSSNSNSGYKCVAYSGKSTALRPYCTKVQGGTRNLGSFATAVEAAVCYAKYVLSLHVKAPTSNQPFTTHPCYWERLLLTLTTHPYY